MFTDLTGTRRYKINLHDHTTRSDGHKTPEEVMDIYARAGYDFLAITDHWVWGDAGEYTYRNADGSEGHMTILPGAEYNVGGGDGADGVYHILGLGCTHDPGLTVQEAEGFGRTSREQAQQIIGRIKEAGGFAVLAHPAWSLNTVAQILPLLPLDATEIYNSVSECHMSDRPYAGLILDQLAVGGTYLPLLATDDSHYYDGDHCHGMIMAEADAVDSLGLWETLRQNRFYATNGPEIHLERLDELTFRLRCSPAVKIAFLSNMVWTAGRMVRGENLTEATYTLKEGERYVRAEILTADGQSAWSPIIRR